MDVSLRSLVAYAAACGLLLAIAAVGVVLWFVTSGKMAIFAKPKTADGHFFWAEEEMAQLAAETAMERRRHQSTFDAALFRAELEIEARRIIGELSNSRGGKPPVNVEKAVARGLRLTTFYRAKVPSPKERWDQRSYFQELRRVVDREEGRARLRDGRPLRLASPSLRRSEAG